MTVQCPQLSFTALSRDWICPEPISLVRRGAPAAVLGASRLTLDARGGGLRRTSCSARLKPQSERWSDSPWGTRHSPGDCDRRAGSCKHLCRASGTIVLQIYVHTQNQTSRNKPSPQTQKPTPKHLYEIFPMPTPQVAVDFSVERGKRGAAGVATRSNHHTPTPTITFCD